MKLLVVFVLLCCVARSVVDAVGCKSSVPPHGKPNLFPVNDLTMKESPNKKLVLTIPNGKAYRVTVPNSGGDTVQTFVLAHVYGTPYEMGFAQGLMMKELNNGSFIKQVWSYLENQAESGLPGYLPLWLKTLISELGLGAALDLTEAATYEYTNPTIYQLLSGLSDSSGEDYRTIVRVHMLAGLTQGDCSMIGAWGKALADPSGLLQLRALDWNMDGPFRDYNAITVYHPSHDGHDFVNVGFLGFIGAITGISEAKLAISEIGVAFPDTTFGSESRIGVPFIFILHDILAYDNSLEQATLRMKNARRTCDLIIGVGDGNIGEFRGFSYSYSQLGIYDDTNMLPMNTTWHPRIQDTCYWGMDWICPAFNEALSELLAKYHGQITPELAMSYISPVEQSGSNHVVYYDLKNMDFFVAFAAPHNVAGSVPAYDRQYTKLDAMALFAETL